ncbi:UNVERIFIED_CONTAM: LINE-1 retrotransposable element O protein [Sesamum latifolium]|uniref:LINE-1 retrotransposable element O protein n=1 Tax=Sesamum latifolium TaxID=2727402 RepID=A0AAW2WDQ1_9LAMI
MLSSLTHITPYTHTSPNHALEAADTADEDGDDGPVDGKHGGDGPPMTERGDGVPSGVHMPRDFNLTEFLSLANRVVDEGDTGSWAALRDLQQRWVEKFGDGSFTLPVGGGALKPVATRPATPFPPQPLRVPRRAYRNLTLAPPSRVSIEQERAPIVIPSPSATCFPLSDIPRRLILPEHGVSDSVSPPADAPPPRVLEGPHETLAMETRVFPSAPLVDPLSPSHDTNGDIVHPSVIRSCDTTLSNTSTPPAASPPAASIYIGNVPLATDSNSFDKIAAAFNNSSRKTLSFIPPSLQNGEVVVRPSLQAIRDGSRRWSTTAVGYFMVDLWTTEVLQSPMNSEPVVHVEPNASRSSFDSVSNSVDRGDKEVAVYWFVGDSVSALNVARVQRGILPQWSWYVDYTGPGNRIWLAWDDEFLGLDVLEVDAQCVHCKAFIRCIHTHVLLTIVYGVNDVVGWRMLWSNLARISPTVGDAPWLVGGDFNTVLDSEVCRHSGDIRGAAEDFQACLHDTGLIHLPMQGEWFTWHNCSSDSRSLWKRLDHFLVNDCWLGCWPNTYYASLNARTSDHSPLVLRGNIPYQSVSMFRFDNYLTLSSDFTPSVQSIWQHHIVGTAMFAVTRKLKALKPIFRAQRQKKGDLSNNVKLAASFLDAAQILLARDRCSPLLLQLEFCCKMILRLATKLEQHMLHQRAKIAWMKGGDQCSRIFFRKVARRRSSRSIFQITDSTGQVLTNQTDVVNEFITYYQTLLGGVRQGRLIDFLRPWARHIISEEEALLLMLPVTPEEVKQVVFDIDEVQAPGPDGYSSGFFKTAWPIVGEEVTRAIMDFFVTGRMRGILDKLISPSQNAFVPGRSIGCHLLLTQELFNGYNQQHLPPRCALKVDIRKAYDTVEWDFLSTVLKLFGFPERFILWIEECVTSPSFSVCLNGSPHGFFKGARGLRQGDPMSPYLFVLVMEVLNLILQQIIAQTGGFSFHWRCEELQLFQLGFADDLLLFSRADTASVHIFIQGLTVFVDLSGLHVNPQKSHLILSRSAAVDRDTLLSILDFREGLLPLRYLGLPLLASRLSIADCKPILLKIDSRIKGWDGIMLSFAGQVQLIKSVLTALQVYWAMAFILPKMIIREIEKRLRSFLWKGCTGVGYAKVYWQQTGPHYGWTGFFSIVFGAPPFGRSVIALDHGVGGNWFDYGIGSGNTFSLWHDPWHELGPIILRFPLGPQHSSTSATALLSTVIVDGNWGWPSITNMESIEITHSLPLIHGGADRILWKGTGGSFSPAAAYDVFHPLGPKVGWSSLLVGTFKIPRHLFILWLAILGRLSTLDKPCLQHLGTDCVLCQTTIPETHDHLFFRCHFATECLSEMQRVVRFHWPHLVGPSGGPRRGGLGNML